MPDSITIGGVALKLVAFQERAREQRGDAVRTFDNTLADGRDLPKRTWDGTSLEMTPATEATLRLAVGSGPVVCSGLVLYGESVLCAVDVENAPRGPDVQSGPPDESEVNVTLSLVLREV
jgi:hypothetical protein